MKNPTKIGAGIWVVANNNNDPVNINGSIIGWEHKEETEKYIIKHLNKKEFKAVKFKTIIELILD